MLFALSSGALMLDIIVIVIILVWGGSYLFNRWRRNHYATVIDAEEFQKGIHRAQVLDLRSKDDFRAGHILGARSMPLAFLQQQYGELRSDLPIYLYDTGEALSTQGAAFLGKRGYHNIYILKGGYQKWQGKTKKDKYLD